MSLNYVRKAYEGIICLTCNLGTIEMDGFGTTYIFDLLKLSSCNWLH